MPAMEVAVRAEECARLPVIPGKASRAHRFIGGEISFCTIEQNPSAGSLRGQAEVSGAFAAGVQFQNGPGMWLDDGQALSSKTRRCSPSRLGISRINPDSCSYIFGMGRGSNG